MRKSQRETKQRKLVYEAVQKSCSHPKADEIFESVNSIDPKISKGTVYRNLGFLSENGNISHIKVPGADRYDGRLDLHCHILCTSCGKVVDAPIEYQYVFDEQVSQLSGFSISRHRTVFEGLCPDCLKAKSEEEYKEK